MREELMARVQRHQIKTNNSVGETNLYVNKFYILTGTIIVEEHKNTEGAKREVLISA